MIFVLLTALTVPLLGQGALRLLYGRSLADFGWEDRLPVGLCVWIGTWEVCHLAGVFLNRPLSDCALAGVALTGAGGALALLWELIERRRDGDARRRRQRKRLGQGMEKKPLETAAQVPAILFGCSVLLQFLLVAAKGNASWEGDLTLETVRTFLSTGAIYAVNPLTGNPYTAGIPLRIRILSLPTVYASLCGFSGIDPEYLVGRAVPGAVLLISYCAYYGLSKTLFEKRSGGKWIFLAVVTLLIWAGDYLEAMDGYGLMCAGYRGTAIRAGILLPCTLNLCLKKKWRAALPCVLAEACVVWTFYGAGACLLMAALLFALQRRNQKPGVEA